MSTGSGEDEGKNHGTLPCRNKVSYTRYVPALVHPRKFATQWETTPAVIRERCSQRLVVKGRGSMMNGVQYEQGSQSMSQPAKVMMSLYGLSGIQYTLFLHDSMRP